MDEKLQSLLPPPRVIKSSNTRSLRCNGGKKCWRNIAFSVCFLILIACMLRGAVRSNDFSVCRFVKDELNLSCEEHVTSTADGYSLFIKRIPKENAPSVILVHGVADSSATWLVSGRSESLAATLHDQGLDVWLVDRRGRIPWRHERYSGEDAEFWDFSFDDSIEYDIPSVVEYVKKFTGKDIASLIGHAEGGIVSLAALANNDKVSSHVKSTVVFAPPITSWGRTERSMPTIPSIFDSFIHVGVVFGSIRLTFNGFCDQFPGFCAKALCFTSGCGSPEDLNPEVLSKVFAYYPSETSLKNLRHYQQCEKARSLQAFDYGKDENMIRYNSETPKVYDFSNLKTPVAMFFGQNDRFVPGSTTDSIVDLFPKNTIQYFNNSLPYGHQDFVWSKRAHTDVYPAVISFIESHYVH